MAIDYRLNDRVTPGEVADLFRSSGIRRPSEDLGRIRRMLEGANLTVTAWDGERLVGIARALSDRSYCTYLSDLAVGKEYQREGVGRELVRRVREAAGEEAIVLLLAAPDAMAYYPRIGFEKADNAWLLPRNR